MATLTEAVESGSRFRHPGWYDSTWVQFKNPDHHLLFSKKLFTSDQFIIEEAPKVDKPVVKSTPEFKEAAAKKLGAAKKITKKKKRVKSA